MQNAYCLDAKCMFESHQKADFGAAYLKNGKREHGCVLSLETESSFDCCSFASCSSLSKYDDWSLALDCL